MNFSNAAKRRFLECLMPEYGEIHITFRDGRTFRLPAILMVTMSGEPMIHATEGLEYSGVIDRCEIYREDGSFSASIPMGSTMGTLGGRIEISAS